MLRVDWSNRIMEIGLGRRFVILHPSIFGIIAAVVVIVVFVAKASRGFIGEFTRIR